MNRNISFPVMRRTFLLFCSYVILPLTINVNVDQLQEFLLIIQQKTHVKFSCLKSCVPKSVMQIIARYNISGGGYSSLVKFKMVKSQETVLGPFENAAGTIPSTFPTQTLSSKKTPKSPTPQLILKVYINHTLCQGKHLGALMVQDSIFGANWM